MTGMMTGCASAWLGLLGLVGVLGGTPAQAQQFAAEIVATPARGPAAAPGRLSVRDGKVRIETPEFPDGFFVVDSRAGAAWFVRPSGRIFMEARQSSRLTRLLAPVDPDEPCRQWQAMAQLAGAASESDPWRCERIGAERIEGRDAVIYRATPPTGRGIVAWVDPQLEFPLRIRTEDGATIAVAHLQQVPQSEQLFAIPPGFRKFDPQALIGRIKNSDVWVEDPRP